MKSFKAKDVKLHQCDEECEAKAIVITGTYDVPAKACLMCMTGHSGYCSCPKCFIVGENSDKTEKVTVFPQQEELELRDDENYNKCLEQSMASKQELLGTIAMLNKSSISSEELVEADMKLREFCCDFEKLYGVRQMSSNVHLLRHLAASVYQTSDWKLIC
ncbi:Glutathione S-transferase omega-like 1 [Frankliniella fusca]|uniref:Glutathione S-transferase omega-like 1 n=1 Tax=Frankliniella fusca TaxID=407009 RepID=A0AAE1GYP6_9NEOP|nr:Glutathione S-transferase omega-like 1 [Frankliniella fusca]